MGFREEDHDVPRSVEAFRTSVRRTTSYVIARRAWTPIAAALGARREPTSRVVSLTPDGPAKGDALVSYRLESFLSPPDDAGLRSHTAFWRSAQIARTFLDLGYRVDVISPRNTGFVPRKPYSIVLDTRRILEQIVPALDEACVKIVWLDLAQTLFHNAAEARRLLALQVRRGITLPPARFTAPSRAIEIADVGMTSGNDFTIGTFRYAGKPIYRLPIICQPSPWPDDKDHAACRRRFLWFGSQGFLHKGLDLVLEAFAGLPDHHLTVAGPLHEEQDFVRAFHRELFETPNIETVGWVDMESERFRSIARRCVAVLHPSCSEAGSTSTMHCMHSGMVPVVSHEAAVDVDDFGVIVKGERVEDVRDAVLRISAMPPAELEQRSREAWTSARSYHTVQSFVVEYRKAIESILDWAASGRRGPAPGLLPGQAA
jgi:glycosyltransferase involved in cell wall biosynthesis